MTIHFLDNYKFEEINGEIKVTLLINPSNGKYDTEFSLENGFFETSKKEMLKESAIQFIKRKMPMLKVATVVVLAGALIVSSFPLHKAQAHEVDFNMTYLYFGNTKSYISQVDSTKGNLSLVSPSYFDINSNGSLKITSQYDPAFVKEMHNRGIKVVPFLSNHWDRNLGRVALENREQLASQIADFIIKNNLDGVQVDIENVTDVDRDNYTDLVRLLNEKVPSHKEVSVAVAANPNGWTKGWHGSYDYKELAKHSDYFMIMAYDESYTGGPEGPVASYGWVERSIQYALKQGVPPEKVVMGIPFYGRYWKEGATSGGEGISNKRVDELLAKYGGEVIFDATSKSPKAIITIKEGDPQTIIAGKTLGVGTYHIWYENHESIKAKLQLIHKYNIKGSGSWSLGQENTSIWQNYRSWISHDGSISVSPSNPNQPKEQTGTVQPTQIQTHTVQAGDTLWGIANKYKVTIDQLKQFNNLNSERINVGQILSLAPTPILTPNIEQNTTSPAPTTSTPGAISAPILIPEASASIPKVTPPTPREAPSLVGKNMVPKVNNTYVRNGASTTGKIVKKLNTLETVKVTQSFTDPSKVTWLKVQSGTSSGWVLASQLSIKQKIPVKPKVTVPTKYPNLKVGSKGTEVADMQRKLKTANFLKGDINGKFDSNTKTAVLVFQKKYKLKADGIAGPTTLSKLDSIVNGK